jgi:hypothetical protein
MHVSNASIVLAGFISIEFLGMFYSTMVVDILPLLDAHK